MFKYTSLFILLLFFCCSRPEEKKEETKQIDVTRIDTSTAIDGDSVEVMDEDASDSANSLPYGFDIPQDTVETEH